jgi:hypothetical protein
MARGKKRRPEAGCRDTVTFDRALKDAPGFRLL